MKQARGLRLAATGSKMLAGAVVIAACIGGALLAGAAPLPTVTHTPAMTDVQPLPGDTIITCTGTFRALGRDADDASVLHAAGDFGVTLGSDGEYERAAFATPDLVGASASHWVAARPIDRDATLVGAAEAIRLADEDLAGFAASACREPAMEAWLVGGSAAVGAADSVLLANPGDVTATVRITVYGSTVAPTTTGVVVPARTELTLPLASMTVGEAAPVLHVTAQGAPVRAALQSSLVRVLDPAGIDLQGGAGAADTALVITGVRVVLAPSDAPATILRLLAPDTATDAHITVTPAGATEPAVSDLTVPLGAGVPVEVSLGDLAPGVYTVEIESDTPVIGAVWQTTGFAAGSDFAWMTPAPAFTGRILAAVPTGADAQVQFANSGETDAIVSFGPIGGAAPRTLTVPAGGSQLTGMAPGVVYEIDTDAPVHAAVTLSGDAGIAGWPLWPGVSAAGAITVYR